MILTHREGQVAAFIREGRTNKAIALLLDISVHTVKFHVDRLLAKLGAENRAAVAVLSMDVEIATPKVIKARAAGDEKHCQNQWMDAVDAVTALNERQLDATASAVALIMGTEVHQVRKFFKQAIKKGVLQREKCWGASGRAFWVFKCVENTQAPAAAISLLQPSEHAKKTIEIRLRNNSKEGQ